MIVTNENEIIVDAKRRRAPIIMSIHLSADLSCGSWFMEVHMAVGFCFGLG